tara:strand:+ start:9110 stop:9502 length:393 start_codon:yes stop_codon:yes gene_type:complete
MTDDTPIFNDALPWNRKLVPRRTGGRPKGSLNVKSIVSKIANEKHKIMEGGKARHHTTIEVLLLKLRNLAIQGDRQAATELNRERDFFNPPSQEEAGCIIAPGEISAEEWVQREEIHNRFRKPPEGYEPS